MEDLFPVVRREIGGEEVFVVNARELHAFVMSRDRFATWIKERIKQHSLVENVDFSISTWVLRRFMWVAGDRAYPG
ncbi:hypothetical protein A5904_05875 [Acidithiobacillus caldus]|uniref:antA/AntB antirepressor family protein n=1 Tax=Acidithiobacillus caldus TaxID=33059 RepID=UPI000CD3417D|nr:antA/AntB antirepressor family protein [Acidithiobacillus caldus]AUW32549.1 hypothetical protein A5904_05875 [Acidithiobacillus caldus]